MTSIRNFVSKRNIINFYKKSSIVFLIMTIFFSSTTPASFMYGFRSLIEGIDKVYASTNAASKQYIINIGPVNGSTTANYVFATFFNPSGSGRTASIKHISVFADTASSTASNYVDCYYLAH